MNRLLSNILWAAIVLSTGTSYAANQFDFLLSQVRTSVGALPGGKVYFYSPGTTTPKAVWLDPNEGTLAANPYTLDSNGTALVYGSGAYRIVIKDANLVTKYDRSPVAVTGEDGSQTVIDATSGNATFSLPAGGMITISKSDATANTVTISPSVGGQTIGGIASYILYGQYETVTMVMEGTTWYIK